MGLAFVEKLADVYGWECKVMESAAGGARFEFTDMDNWDVSEFDVLDVMQQLGVVESPGE